MEENFEALLEMYMNEEEINEKIKSDNKEIKEEEKNNEKVSESKKDIRKYKEYAISMNEFLSKYLKMNTHKLRTATLSHKDLKYLTIGNPLVVGIYNGYVDIDEIIKNDYLLVYDCNGDIGSYLNPDKLRDLTKVEFVSKQYEIVRKSRIRALEDLDEFYKKYCSIKDELDYLTLKCSGYEEMLTKARKNGSVGKIKKYVHEHGNSSLDINLRSASN